jgi:hypothetical protein
MLWTNYYEMFNFISYSEKKIGDILVGMAFLTDNIT